MAYYRGKQTKGREHSSGSVAGKSRSRRVCGGDSSKEENRDAGFSEILRIPLGTSRKRVKNGYPHEPRRRGKKKNRGPIARKSVKRHIFLAEGNPMGQKPMGTLSRLKNSPRRPPPSLREICCKHFKKTSELQESGQEPKTCVYGISNVVGLTRSRTYNFTRGTEAAYPYDFKAWGPLAGAGWKKNSAIPLRTGCLSYKGGGFLLYSPERRKEEPLERKPARTNGVGGKGFFLVP